MSASSVDPFNLERFVQAQEGVYAQALSEIRAGEKRTHWMWFIFPQALGLGFSPLSQYYGIRSLDEAQAYLAHPVLGARLRECFEALLRLEGRSTHQIFGSPDDWKLRSCATLFALISSPGSVFHQVLDRYFDGHMDDRTIALMGKENAS
ncbi:MULTISPECIES: DUF1810 domain-containing protein [Anaerolinea]|uniref:DUF1810 domain-containing protein n=1 Tax=Anaerolinea TaxID=233189 RepID=UPI002FDAF835